MSPHGVNFFIMENNNIYVSQEIIERVKEHDMEAFEQMVAMISNRITNLAYSFTSDKELAKDICQEVLFIIWCKISGIRDNLSFKNWVYKITLHVSNQKLRKIYRQKKIIEKSKTKNLEESMDNVDIGERYALSEKIDKAILKLSETQRKIFVLKHQEGLKISEIAEIIGCSPGTVKVHLYRAIRNIRKVIDEM